MMDKLRAAFPNADEVTCQVKDYGFSKGIGVRFGTKRHAVRWQGSLDETIATLQRITRR